MEIVLSAVEKGGDYPIAHDLNFAAARYEAKHPIVGRLYTVLLVIVEESQLILVDGF